MWVREAQLSRDEDRRLVPGAWNMEQCGATPFRPVLIAATAKKPTWCANFIRGLDFTHTSAGQNTINFEPKLGEFYSGQKWRWVLLDR